MNNVNLNYTYLNNMDSETLHELLLEMKQQKNQWEALHEQDLLSW